MAKAIKLGRGKEFTFAPKGSFGAGAKYKWNEWFSGQLLVLVQGTDEQVAAGDADFPTGISPQAMMPKILTAARKRFKICEASSKVPPGVFRDGDLDSLGAKLNPAGTKLTNAVIIRARDMMEDEKAAELVRRKEEKIRRDALHAEQAAAGVPLTNGDEEGDEDDDSETE